MFDAVTGRELQHDRPASQGNLARQEDPPLPTATQFRDQAISRSFFANLRESGPSFGLRRRTKLFQFLAPLRIALDHIVEEYLLALTLAEAHLFPDEPHRTLRR